MARCGKAFSKKSALKRHIKDVHEGTKYKCDICDKDFSQDSAVSLHIRNVHKIKSGKAYSEDMRKEVDKYACNFCEQPFDELSILKPHLKICFLINKP